jgi:hypothetical protein
MGGSNNMENGMDMDASSNNLNSSSNLNSNSNGNRNLQGFMMDFLGKIDQS